MIDIIKEKLRQYGAENALEEENAVKEILQEIALYALWRADFFDVALFQGGTSLRILHGLSRFSEDLDFLLRAPDPEFDWTPYLNALTDVVGQFGLKLDAQARPGMEDYKTQLQEVCQKRYESLPQYETVRESGPDHEKVFEVELTIQGVMRGIGRGRSKKEAEQMAAKEALTQLA